MSRWMLWAAAALVVTGCGSDTALDDSRMARAVMLKELVALQRGKAAAADPVAGIARAAIDQGGNPLLRVRLEKTGQIALLGKLAEADGVVSWATTDGITLSLRDGIMLASRGMANDLMSAAVPAAAAVSTAGHVVRRHFLLFGGEQEAELRFDCTVSYAGPQTIVVVELAYATQHWVEACAATANPVAAREAGFRNEYWFDQSGKIRQSRQWIGADVGYLELQDLVR